MKMLQMDEGLMVEKRHGAAVGQEGRIFLLCSARLRWGRLPARLLTRFNLSPRSPPPHPSSPNPLTGALKPSPSSFTAPTFSSLLFLLRQAGSEMAISGKAVGLYFEEKLQEMFPGQNFPETPEAEPPDEKEREEETEDSEDDFIQPRRKRLKTDEKVVHIK